MVHQRLYIQIFKPTILIFTQKRVINIKNEESVNHSRLFALITEYRTKFSNINLHGLPRDVRVMLKLMGSPSYRRLV